MSKDPTVKVDRLDTLIDLWLPGEDGRHKAVASARILFGGDRLERMLRTHGTLLAALKALLPIADGLDNLGAAWEKELRRAERAVREAEEEKP